MAIRRDRSRQIKRYSAGLVPANKALFGGTPLYLSFTEGQVRGSHTRAKHDEAEGRGGLSFTATISFITWLAGQS